jgi:hypothetical protein
MYVKRVCANDRLQKSKPKAVALLTGGLDNSFIIMLKHGVEIEETVIETSFCDFEYGKRT